MEQNLSAQMFGLFREVENQHSNINNGNKNYQLKNHPENFYVYRIMVGNGH